VIRAIAAPAERAWDRFWFAPDSAYNLAGLRILVAAHALWFLLSRDLASISALDVFWSSVRAADQWRFLLFPGHPLVERTVQALALGALVCAVLGIHARLACLVAGLSLYHLAPLETIIWTPAPFARGLTLAPLLLILLAVAPSADVLVLWPRRASAPPEPSWRYGWPRRLTWLLVAQVYLFAAFAKATTSGLAWGSGDNIRRWLLLFALDDQWRFHALGSWLAAHPLLCWGLAVGTLVLEWSFVLAVFSRRARAVLVPAMLAFQITIYFAMSIYVGEAVMLLAFVDVHDLGRRLSAWFRGRRAPAVSRAVLSR